MHLDHLERDGLLKVLCRSIDHVFVGDPACSPSLCSFKANKTSVTPPQTTAEYISILLNQPKLTTPPWGGLF